GAGWLTSFNAFDPEGAEIAGIEYNFQPYYAQQFYEVVSEAKVFPTLAEGEQPTDITLVGHSLGGSLAGYIGSLTGNNTRIFNEIPYIGMALNTAIDNFISQNAHNGVAALTEALEKIANGLAPVVEGFSFTEFISPDTDSITSFRMTGEVAGVARFLGPIIGLATNFFVSKRIENLKAIPEDGVPDVSSWETASDLIGVFTSIVSGIYGIAVPDSTVQEVSSYAGFRPAITLSLHSQALMAIELFAGVEPHIEWQSIGPELFDALFSAEIAETIGADQFGGYAEAGEKMQIALAYSALDEGELVFGNTGIRAMFDDANELGKLVTDDRVPSALEDAIPGITQAIVQFAGQMALREVRYQDHLDWTPEKGFLGLNAEETVLKLDLAKELWNLGGEDPDADLEIMGIQTILDSFFGKSPELT
ncbi:MAG: hypothetical protein GY753_10830, partial [Gammaproteobacteria bacterium]|nr:hypothetical protein [Gammaproteobacteria bacterium]